MVNVETKRKARMMTFCQSNIARSQMARAIIEDVTGLPVESAGIKVAEENWKYGHHPSQEVIAVMAEIGLDVSDYPVKQFDTEMLPGMELLIVLCDPEICPSSLFGATAAKILYQLIDDPRGGNLEAFRKTRDQIRTMVHYLHESGVFDDLVKEEELANNYCIVITALNCKPHLASPD